MTSVDETLLNNASVTAIDIICNWIAEMEYWKPFNYWHDTWLYVWYKWICGHSKCISSFPLTIFRSGQNRTFCGHRTIALTKPTNQPTNHPQTSRERTSFTLCAIQIHSLTSFVASTGRYIMAFQLQTLRGWEGIIVSFVCEDLVVVTRVNYQLINVHVECPTNHSRIE